MKKNELSNVTRTGLIINIVFSSIGVIGAFIGILSVILGMVLAYRTVNGAEPEGKLTIDTAKFMINVLIFAGIFLVIFWILAVWSLAVSSLIFKGKSKRVILAGILAIFTGLIIGGVLILVGNKEKK